MVDITRCWRRDSPAHGARPGADPGGDCIVIDPHKRGLQPYGCGAVFFDDPTVGRFDKHDSPYTDFTSAELHLGEISLECSRAGAAAAAALWLTLRAVPLEPVLAAARRAAPRRSRTGCGTPSCCGCTSEPGARHRHLPTAGRPPVRDRRGRRRDARAGMDDLDDPVFLSTAAGRCRRPRRAASRPRGRRAGGPDPAQRAHEAEHEAAVPWLASRVEALARASPAAARRPPGG